MNYTETIEYLYSAAPAFEKVGAGAYKEGLTNTEILDRHFNHPHRRYKTIHIAGTNGKGSVSHSIAAILQTAGFRVGLYTSPHLVDFCERIRVNGAPVSKQYVIDFVEKEKDFFEPLSPSFFEITTAMAFQYFAEQNVDIAVIEVGLGGRLDCTNIISPILTIITNISYDHTDLLGNTLEKIAREKAGIIKPNTPIIIGEHTEETKNVFLHTATEKQAPVLFAEDNQYILTDTYDNDSFTRRYTTSCFGIIISPLGGKYQEKNLNTILNAMLPLAKALKKAGMPLTKSDMRPLECLHKALHDVCDITGLMGRWQILCKKPLIICDTGHNLAGWEYLSEQLRSVHLDTKKSNENSKLHIVFGMVNDKDINAVLKLLPQDAIYYFTQASTHRAIPSDELQAKANKLSLKGECFQDVSSAYHCALGKLNSDDVLFIGGSSYVVADLLCELTNTNV